MHQIGQQAQENEQRPRLVVSRLGREEPVPPLDDRNGLEPELADRRRDRGARLEEVADAAKCSAVMRRVGVGGIFVVPDAQRHLAEEVRLRHVAPSTTDQGARVQSSLVQLPDLIEDGIDEFDGELY